MKNKTDKYEPSNGIEGMGFTEKFCEQCLNERWCHFPEEDKDEDKCDIWSRTMLFRLSDPEYPEEWTYDNNGNPTCTAFVKWDWGNDDNGFNEPPPKPEPADPRQLCMPFELDNIEYEEKDTNISKAERQASTHF